MLSYLIAVRKIKPQQRDVIKTRIELAPIAVITRMNSAMRQTRSVVVSPRIVKAAATPRTGNRTLVQSVQTQIETAKISIAQTETITIVEAVSLQTVAKTQTDQINQQQNALVVH